MRLRDNLQSNRFEFKCIVNEPRAAAIGDSVRGYLEPDPYADPQRGNSYQLSSRVTFDRQLLGSCYEHGKGLLFASRGTDMDKPHNEDVMHGHLTDCFLRFFWMIVGNAILVFCVVSMVKGRSSLLGLALDIVAQLVSEARSRGAPPWVAESLERQP